MSRGRTLRRRRLVAAITPDRVRDFRRHGSTAVKLAAELCGRSRNIERGYGYGVPGLLANRLSEADRNALAQAHRDQAAEDDTVISWPDPETHALRTRAYLRSGARASRSPRDRSRSADSIDHFHRGG